MRKRVLWLTVFFCLVGAAIAAISTSQYLRINRQGLEEKSFCAISEVIDCDITTASSYATLAGIPVAWLGLVMYLLIGGMAARAALSKREKKGTVAFAWFLSIFSLLYSIRMAYVLFFVLGVACLECVGMYIVNIVLFFALWAAVKVPPKDVVKFFKDYLLAVFRRPSDLGFAPNIFAHILATLLVFGVGWMAIYNIRGESAENGIPVGERVNAHFQQSLYSIDADPSWPLWGNPAGKVTIIEFSDYECPFCRLAAFNIRPYLQEFKKNIRFYFVNYPLDDSCNPYMEGPMHRKACMAAFATECAFERGDFWGFHDDVFRLKRSLSRESLIELARKRGWNADEFAACMDSDAVKAKVLSGIEAARKIHVSGTPTIIVNGRRLKYWRDPDLLRAVVKEEVKRSRK